MALMLIKDPKQRITPDNALKHPYFIKNGFHQEKKINKKRSTQSLSVIAEDEVQPQSPVKKHNHPEVNFNQVNPIDAVSIKVDDIIDNEDVKSEEGNNKKRKRPKATTYGKITNRSQSIRLRKVYEINLKNLKGDSRIDDEESPLKNLMKNMNKAQLARYEKLLNGDAGTKSMNIPRLGFQFDLKTADGLKLKKRHDSDSSSHESAGNIELMFPEKDAEEIKEPSAATDSDHLT